MDNTLSHGLVKKLALIAVLSTTITESNINSGSLFSDIRVSLYSKMLNNIKTRWEDLSLYRFLPELVKPTIFLDWIDTELYEYKDKDMFITPSFTNIKEGDIYKYHLEPQFKDPHYLYYNLSIDRIMYILQRIPQVPVFPCRYSIYIETNIDDIVLEAIKRRKT